MVYFPLDCTFYWTIIIGALPPVNTTMDASTLGIQKGALTLVDEYIPMFHNRVFLRPFAW